MNLFFHAFQSECRILLQKHSNENLVLQAVMDEFEESREKGNLTAEILNREKVKKMSQNITKYHKMSQNVTKCHKMSQNINFIHIHAFGKWVGICCKSLILYIFLIVLNC